jgi:hypothetical protein
MMPFVDSYDKASHDVGLRHVEWYEVAEVLDTAEESDKARGERWNPIHSLTAWLTSLVHPAPVPQVRRHHA